jgi:hypothetical protein
VVFSAARFSTAGTFVLRFTATDGQLTSLADVTVTVEGERVGQRPAGPTGR